MHAISAGTRGGSQGCRGHRGRLGAAEALHLEQLHHYTKVPCDVPAKLHFHLSSHGQPLVALVPVHLGA